MSDLSAYSAHEFGPLCTVLRSVMDITARPGEQIMLVGASARDLIHRGLGFDSELASTTDIDIAIAVPDRFAYQSVVASNAGVAWEPGFRVFTFFTCKYGEAGKTVDYCFAMFAGFTSKQSEVRVYGFPCFD